MNSTESAPIPDSLPSLSRRHWLLGAGGMLLLWTGPVRAAGAGRDGAPLKVCVSTPDLASLVAEVGGAQVTPYSFSRGPEDPHEVEIRPSLVRELEAADLFVQVGLGIENAWLKDLVGPVKRSEVKPGGRAHLNAGQGVKPLEGVVGQPIPGSFHEEGNPHYLLDPVEGLRVAGLVRDRLQQLRPASAGLFASRYDAFRRRLTAACLGPACAGDDLFAVAAELEQAASTADREKLRQRHRLEGWLGGMLPHAGKAIVGDHDLWPYLARRCGLDVAGYLEPSPGVAPTTKHLRGLIDEMKRRKIRVLLSAPYFEERHARFVAANSGCRIVPMCHQTGARPGTDDYLAMLGHNFTQLIDALKAA